MVMMAFLPYELDNFNPVQALTFLNGLNPKHLFILLIHTKNNDLDAFTSLFASFNPSIIKIEVNTSSDPLNIRSRIALKMIMNAHSTAVMTKLGRVVGNTMTNVRAANLKLIGRATYLAKMHIDDILKRGLQHREPISYSEANALLMDSIDYLAENDRAAESPVPLTIVRACEGVKEKRDIGFQECDMIL